MSSNEPDMSPNNVRRLRAAMDGNPTSGGYSRYFHGICVQGQHAKCPKTWETQDYLHCCACGCHGGDDIVQRCAFSQPLLASAPGLLAALERALEWAEDPHDWVKEPEWFDAARAAIAKARGR